MLETTEVERRLIDAAQTGELLDVSGEADRNVRAAVIRGLLCDWHEEALDPRGVRLQGAHIIGVLDLTDVRTAIPLVLTSCVHGEKILLTRAHLPHLDLTGCVFPEAEGDDFACEHDARLDGVRCKQLTLTNANIEGTLSLSDAQLNATDGSALYGDRLKIGGNFYLDYGFSASSVSSDGTLCMPGVTVAGQLIMSGAELTATRGPALTADQLTVKDNLFLDDGFTAISESEMGTVRICGATLTRISMRESVVLNIDCSGPALDISNSQVDSNLIIPIQSFLPEGGDPFLVDVFGLRYSLIPQDATYLEWIELLTEHTPGYAAQPYQQLAAVHRESGHDQEARQILVAQQRDLRRRGELDGRGRKLLHAMSGAFIGHGHRPFRALSFLAGICLLSGFVVAAASWFGLTIRPAPSDGVCSPAESVGLALDTAVPLLKTGGAKQCQITTTTPLGQVLYVIGLVLQVLGWAFATLFVAGYTGLVRKVS